MHVTVLLRCVLAFSSEVTALMDDIGCIFYICHLLVVRLLKAKINSKATEKPKGLFLPNVTKGRDTMFKTSVEKTRNIPIANGTED